MPLCKPVENLRQISIVTLTNFIYQSIEPHKLQNNILSFYKKKQKSSDNKALNLEHHFLPSQNLVNSNLHMENELPAVVEEIDNESIINSEDYKIQLNVVHKYVKCLISDLASISHCGLHFQLFWSIMPKLNILYTKNNNQKLKKLIQDIVPIFINSCIKEFDFGSLKMFTEALMFEKIYSWLKEATGLEKLVFGRSCYWRSKSIQNLSKILQEMNLQILHIHYICQPDMLVGLSNSCSLLRELSLKGSINIKDSEISLMINFKNLDTLDISGTSITGKGCHILIKSLPNLIWLTHCPFNCNSDILIFQSRNELFNYIKTLRQQTSIEIPDEKELSISHDIPNNSALKEDCNDTSSEKNNEHFLLNLKSIWLFNTTTEELFLTHLCPQLEHLRLDFVFQDLEVEPDITSLRNLPTLRSLYIYMYDRCPVQLVSSIVETGISLTYLHLHLGDEWFFVAPIANIISQSCRNLIHLTMEGDYKGQHFLEESDSRLDFTLPPGGLPNLVEAKIAGCVSDLRLLHLLTQAPNLHLIYLDGELEWLHDDTFTEAISLSLLLHLKELWFNVSTGVTLASVRRLLKSENNLHRVGRLCLMASSSKDVYQDLLYYVKKSNIDVELIWVTDQREMQLKPSLSI